MTKKKNKLLSYDYHWASSGTSSDEERYIPVAVGHAFSDNNWTAETKPSAMVITKAAVRYMGIYFPNWKTMPEELMKKDVAKFRYFHERIKRMMRHKAQLNEAIQLYAQHSIDHPELYEIESSPPLSSSKEEEKSNIEPIDFNLS